MAWQQISFHHSLPLRSRTAPAQHVERSAIILHLADHRGATEIAATLGIDRQRVTRCGRRVTAVVTLWREKMACILSRFDG